MPKFAANLSMQFTEWPFLERFDAAAAAGFTAVECLFPYDFPAEVIAQRLLKNGLTLALFNMPPGDLVAGDRGLAALADRFEDFKAGVARALAYGEATGARRIHMMAGIADRMQEGAQASYRRAVRYASERLAPKGIDLLIEPINGRSVPGYFLNDFAYAEGLLNELALPNLKLQFDIFHRQILHGDVTMALRRLLPLVGHIQVASVPSRHEPGSEELNDAFVFAELDRLGYDGFIGCEYQPRAGTLAGLRWFEPFQMGQR